jgi:DNA-binding response OmpR family regulator
MREYPSGSSPSASSFLEQRTQPGLTVLFVDPDFAQAERLAHPLRSYATIAIVSSAQAALAAIAERTPDMVVTELELPDVSGLDLLRRIHSSAATRNVLLMVVTRRTAVGDKIAAFQAGADDYLVKPVAPDRFETHVLLVSRFRKVIRQ